MYDPIIEQAAMDQYGKMQTTKYDGIYKGPWNTYGATRIGDTSKIVNQDVKIISYAKTVNGEYYQFQTTDGSLTAWADIRNFTEIKASQASIERSNTQKTTIKTEDNTTQTSQSVEVFESKEKTSDTSLSDD